MARVNYKRELTNPIRSIDEEVKVNDDGVEYYLARCKNIVKEVEGVKIVEMGGSVALDVEDIEEYGIDGLIGARVNRWVVA